MNRSRMPRLANGEVVPFTEVGGARYLTALVGGGRGGNGVRGSTSEAGSVPGGGGGGSADQGGVGAAGARGEVRVWVLG